MVLDAWYFHCYVPEFYVYSFIINLCYCTDFSVGGADKSRDLAASVSFNERGPHNS